MSFTQYCDDDLVVSIINVHDLFVMIIADNNNDGNNDYHRSWTKEITQIFLGNVLMYTHRYFTQSIHHNDCKILTETEYIKYM